MWADFAPKALTREQFIARLAELRWTIWKPIGIVLHNTAAPTLAQWAESGANHDARIRNLESYYEGMGWKGGPHWFVSRTMINEFNNPLRRGTHSPSFNATHFGIEMVGDYDTEEFDSGDGAKVRDNAVFLMAALCKRFGWDPEHAIILHKEDPKTTHECPGHKVDKANVILRVKNMIEGSRLVVDKVNPSHPAEKAWNENILATEFGSGADEQDSAYGGRVNGDKLEVALPFKFRSGRQGVELRANGQRVIARINDVGPHNISDPYWQTGSRPLAEEQFKDHKLDFKGRPVTNPAGIDVTKGVMDALKVPGKPGTRSVLLHWNFTDEQASSHWDRKPTPPAIPTTEPSSEARPTSRIPIDSVTIQVVQQRLDSLGYHEVGTIDGRQGSRTAGAIAAFKRDFAIEPPVGEIDDALLDGLTKAEATHWLRPIAEHRKTADEEQVEKRAPELAPVKQNRFLQFWGTLVAAGGAAVSALGDHFSDALGYVQQSKDYLNLVPGWLWLLAIAGMLAYFYLKSRQGTQAIVDSFRKGERN
jgi:hypothetical protein